MKSFSKYHVYPPIIPDMNDWPIYKIHKDRSAFIQEVNEVAKSYILPKEKKVNLNDLLIKTAYHELRRIKNNPWKVDPRNDKAYWKNIQKSLLKIEDLEEGVAEEKRNVLLDGIINRYNEEIVGTFKKRTFKFARKFLTFFFNKLLSATKMSNLLGIFRSPYKVTNRFKVKGHSDKLRALMKEGTVIIVPTHFSNLDSIIIGYFLDAFLSIPAFTYGAGLNLYNSGPVAYFMNRLGAYRVDRRKKNRIYLTCLKAMSERSIYNGTNTIFFPGGTRARDGAIEKQLKLGLLGTAISAQRIHYQNNSKEKIFVVPMILNYNFVLEAKFLIVQHLRKTGKDQYLKTKDFSKSRRKILKFIWKLFSHTSEIYFSFGQPMDVLGNPVDEKGRSLNKNGHQLKLENYFHDASGTVNKDVQRESEYTQILAEKIVAEFHSHNVVLASQIVAFVAFNQLVCAHSNLDLFGVLKLPAKDFIFDKEAMVQNIMQLKDELQKREANGEILLSKDIAQSPEEILKNGIKNLGVFHVESPLKINRKGVIISENYDLLYYYHNRLSNYDFENIIKWVQ